MSFWRRHFLAITRLAVGLLLLAAIVPMLSRALAVLDPVRAAMIAEVCSARMAPASSAQDAALTGDVTGGVHCPGCTAPALGAAVPCLGTQADFDRPAQRLRPIAQAPRPLRQTDVWPPAPTRAPPSFPQA